MISPPTCAATSARCLASSWPVAATRSSTSRTLTGASTTDFAGVSSTALSPPHAREHGEQHQQQSRGGDPNAPLHDRTVSLPKSPRSITSSASSTRSVGPGIARAADAQRQHAVQDHPGELECRLEVGGAQRARARDLGQRAEHQLARGLGGRQLLLGIGPRRAEQRVVTRVLEPELDERARQLAQVERRVGVARHALQAFEELGEALLDQRVDQPRLVAEVVVDRRRLEAAAIRDAPDGDAIGAALEQERLRGFEDRPCATRRGAAALRFRGDRSSGRDPCNDVTANGVIANRQRRMRIRRPWYQGRMARKRVVVIEGEDAAPEAVRPSVRLLQGFGLPIDWFSPTRDEARAAIDASDATLFGATSGASAAALFHLRWGRQTYANLRPVRFLPGARSPLAQSRGHRSRDRAREPRGPVRRRGGRARVAGEARPAQPHERPADRGARARPLRAEGDQRARQRTRRALRVRAGATAASARTAGARHLRHQAQHAGPDRRAVPRRRDARRARLPGRRLRGAHRRRSRTPPRRARARPRRRAATESVRRHPVGRRCGSRRRPRPRAERLLRRRLRLLRAVARHRARHRRKEHHQPDGDSALGRNAASSISASPTKRGSSSRRSTPTTPTAPRSRPIRAGARARPTSAPRSRSACASSGPCSAVRCRCSGGSCPCC